MILGITLIIFGYTIFYWGLHHMPWYHGTRYSLWTLLGFGNLFHVAAPAQ